MKKLLGVFLTVLIAFAVFPLSAYAADYENVSAQGAVTVTYFDGSRLRINVERISLTSSSTNGDKTYTYSGISGNTMWSATLSANFTYNGTSSSCTAANCSVSVSDSSCYLVSKNVTKSGNAATATVTIGYQLLGVTYRRETYTITLSCDANGNLS